MKKSELLEKILDENNGILRLEDALLAGISKTYALDFIKKNNYEQVARRKKDIPRLMEYAKIFKVDKIIKQYLEVLL